MGMQREYKEDAIIIMEKTINKHLYMVLDGTVALYINYKKPDEYFLGLCSKGNAFGEIGVLCHEESIYTAVAVTDVQLALFSENEIDSFVKGYPEQAIGVMRLMARINKLLDLNLRMVVEEQKYLSKQNTASCKDDKEADEKESTNNNSQMPRCQFCGSNINVGVSSRGYICYLCLKKRRRS